MLVCLRFACACGMSCFVFHVYVDLGATVYFACQRDLFRSDFFAVFSLIYYEDRHQHPSGPVTEADINSPETVDENHPLRKQKEPTAQGENNEHMTPSQSPKNFFLWSPKTLKPPNVVVWLVECRSPHLRLPHHPQPDLSSNHLS